MAITNDYWSQFQPIQGASANPLAGIHPTTPQAGPVLPMQGATPTPPATTTATPVATSGNPMDRNYIRQQLIETVYKPLGLTPTGPGSGPTDIEYYIDKILETGGWTNQTSKGENNIGYWQGRIRSDAGRGGGGTLSSLGGGYGGSYGGVTPGTGYLGQIYGGTFSAPNMIDDPGYQFRLGEGLKAIDRSAAAKGTLLTGGTLKSLAGYASGLASQEYGSAYDRALKTFGANYDIFRNNQSDLFDRYYRSSALGKPE